MSKLINLIFFLSIYQQIIINLELYGCQQSDVNNDNAAVVAALV